MGLKLPEERQEGGIFLRSDVRSTNAGGIVQSNFDADDFEVIGGVVELKNKTSYWSCTGTKFVSRAPDVDDVIRGNATGTQTSQADDNTAYASVELPNGVVVTSVEVFGNAAAAAGITWTLHRMNISSGAISAMASAAVNTADTTISDATVDNSTYGYFLMSALSEWDTNDILNGAIIAYTTDYD